MQMTMRFPGGLAKAVTLSYDDGVFEDIRLVEIMKSKGLKGTFNINGGLFGERPASGHRERLDVTQVKELYLPAGNEVALHGYTHPWLERMPTEQVVCEILRDRMRLEELTGTIVRGMAYPFGTYNDVVLAALRACGVVYSRTIASTASFGLPGDWLQWHPTCAHSDARLNDLTDRFLTASRRPADTCWLFYLWGHSYEFPLDNNWNVIEAFADRVGGRDDIWYATNIEIYNYVEAYKKICTSADGSVVHNPTATTLYFNYGEVPFNHGEVPVVLNPGETKTL